MRPRDVHARSSRLSPQVDYILWQNGQSYCASQYIAQRYRRFQFGRDATPAGEAQQCYKYQLSKPHIRHWPYKNQSVLFAETSEASDI